MASQKTDKKSELTTTQKNEGINAPRAISLALDVAARGYRARDRNGCLR